MNEQRWLCEYCGDVWKESMILWSSSPPKCLKCGETQLVKKLKPSGPMGSNPFGYPDGEKPEVSYGYNED